MPLDIRVHRGRCIATKACTYAAPGVFRLDDTMVATVADPEAASEEEVIEAAQSCPTGAIAVFKDGQQVA